MKTISVFYCLLYAVIEAADINVEGFEGGKVSFQCSHTFARKNHKYLCEDPCEHIKDKLVTVKSGGRAESGRITLVDSGDGSFTVTFSQLQLSDSGRYWCAVDRPGFDTFTSIELTVKEVVANETVKPEFSPTSTYQNISKSTQLTSGMDTSRPANLLTASNSTNGEQRSSTGAVLYATVGAVAVLAFLVLAVIVRKHRENSKPQPQARSNSTDLVSVGEREADCKYDKSGEAMQSMKKTSERFPCTHHPNQDPPTAASTAGECSEPFHIYENVCCSKRTAHSRCSAANVHDKHDISSVVYIRPLPHIPERTGKGHLEKQSSEPTTATTNVTSKPTESCTSSASACHCSDSTEVRPRSLWFGLDLSGTK